MNVDWVAFAGISGAIGTLIMAGVALYSMRQAERHHIETEKERQRERETEKKERLLNEIIEWAKDILSGTSRGTSSLRPICESRDERVVVMTALLQSCEALQAEFELADIDTTYVETVAAQSDLGTAIGAAIKKVAEDLKAFRSFLSDVLWEADPSYVTDVQTTEFSDYCKSLSISSKALIEIAATEKSRLLVDTDKSST